MSTYITWTAWNKVFVRIKGTKHFLNYTLTGSLSMKFSWLNRNPMSVKVRWRNLVGRRTNTKCMFPGKEACKKKEHRRERKHCQNMHSTEHKSENCNERTNFKIIKASPGWCGSVDWAPDCEPKGCWFDSQSGHRPGLWAWSPVGGT